MLTCCPETPQRQTRCHGFPIWTRSDFALKIQSRTGVYKDSVRELQTPRIAGKADFPTVRQDLDVDAYAESLVVESQSFPSCTFMIRNWE